MSKAKNWCFTINNHSGEDSTRLTKLFEDGIVTYIVFGFEVGESGTSHIQGYCQFRERHRMLGAKRFIGLRGHLEVARGSPEQASTYCKKDGSFVEFGEIKKQGKRSDLLAVKAAIEEGADERAIANEFFGSWVRYSKSFAAYRGLLNGRSARQVRVFVLWGPPGVGKTSLVFSRVEDLWIASDPSLQWFDGYGGERSVLIDDFRGLSKSIDESFLLRLLDRYPLQVPIKGGFTPWLAETIYFCCNSPPPWSHISITEALLRRITRVLYVSDVIRHDDLSGNDERWRLLTETNED